MNCLPQSAPLVTLRKARDMVVSEPSTLERLNESFGKCPFNKNFGGFF